MRDSHKISTDESKRFFFILWSIIGVVILVALLFFVLSTIKEVITLFLYAFILVYLLRPIVRFFEEKRLPRFVAVILSYLTFILAFSLIVVAIAPVVISQISGLIEKMPEYFIRLEGLIEQYRSEFTAIRLSPEAIAYLEEVVTTIGQSLLNAFSLLPGRTVSAVSFVVSAILKPFFALIVSFYILMDYETIFSFFLNLVPRAHRQDIAGAIKTVDTLIRGFLKGQAIVILAVTVLSWIVLMILRIEYAFALAVIIGIFDIIPYFGPIIGGGLAIIVALFQNPIAALWLVIAMIAIQQVEAFFISPNVMGKQVGLHPLAVMFAILVGGILLGPLGILLAIPFAASIKGLYFYYSSKREDISL